MLFCIHPINASETGGMELFCCIGSAAVPSLALLLNDEDWTVRYRAAEALGIIGGDVACACWLLPCRTAGIM
ncbi:HEAT repeat domain-containing protein [Methanogenium cariaci]|uniref:HEAT repeat domain-containing protein n=1 Tax=Methanogenium cariaci TaxID=2197 RepID=UPI000781531E|nr:HEAT repeat domain-containing protein [Methanogenium cariaci]